MGHSNFEGKMEIGLLETKDLIGELSNRFEDFAFVGTEYGASRGDSVGITTNMSGDNVKVLGLLTFVEATVLNNMFEELG